MSALVSAIDRMERSILLALQSAGNPFLVAAAPTMLRLFKNNIMPGPATVFADFTEADFTGYTADAITVWSVPALDAVTIRYYLSCAPQSFAVGAGPVTPNTIYGFYLEDGSSNLLLSERFDTPIEMDTTGKTILILPKIFASGIDGPDALED